MNLFRIIWKDFNYAYKNSYARVNEHVAEHFMDGFCVLSEIKTTYVEQVIVN